MLFCVLHNSCSALFSIHTYILKKRRNRSDGRKKRGSCPHTHTQKRYSRFCCCWWWWIGTTQWRLAKWKWHFFESEVYCCVRAPADDAPIPSPQEKKEHYNIPWCCWLLDFIRETMWCCAAVYSRRKSNTGKTKVRPSAICKWHHTRSSQ